MVRKFDMKLTFPLDGGCAKASVHQTRYIQSFQIMRCTGCTVPNLTARLSSHFPPKIFKYDMIYVVYDSVYAICGALCVYDIF